MLRISQIVFSIALISLATIGAIHQDFSIIIPPDPTTQYKWLYTTGSILVIIGGLMVIINRAAFIGSLVCAGSIFIFSYTLKVIPLFAKSSFLQIINSAEGWETLAFVGGCLVLANSFKRTDALFKIGLAILSAWFLWAGIGHYEYLTSVASLIPEYVPFHLFWVYFCGICLILLSIGLWIPPFRIIAAQLAAIMFFLWCVMLHIPNYFTHKPDNEIIMDVFESLAFAALMVIASREFKNRVADKKN